MTELERAYQACDESLDERSGIMMKELTQVYYIAARIHERLPKHVEIGDLVSAGVLGLIEACAKYDGSRDVSFATFAKFRIRGAIIDSLRNLDWGSRALRRQSRAIAASTTKLTSLLGRHPLQEEIAGDLDLSLSELHATLHEIDGLSVMGQQVVSRDGVTEPHDLIESAASRDHQDPFDLCLQAEMCAHLASALQTLSEREQMILSLYYQEELTMREVAEVLDIGTSRVSQIISSSLKKLRTELRHLQHTSQSQIPG
ncbi:FliA/WhiG family RNA polymerase sigma factor [Granulicella sp. 5B5]|uniref:FliA/WhiG family RNA polymerase sigma factor n=1 Tax=Granulicella sp. 5B5 TaxID=1617967 RepID=UPI0015F3CA18|nr:FliA/WhiG family RNA polymerase sigma factor [Granulicella sp. 5B5]